MKKFSFILLVAAGMALASCGTAGTTSSDSDTTTAPIYEDTTEIIVSADSVPANDADCAVVL